MSDGWIVIKSSDYKVRDACLYPTLPPTSCVTLNRLYNPSVSQFPSLQIKNNST